MKKKTENIRRKCAVLAVLTVLILSMGICTAEAETKKLTTSHKTGFSYYALLNYYRTDYDRPSRATHGLIDHYEWGNETVFCVNPWMPAADVSDQYSDSGDFYDWKGISYIEVPQEDGTRVPLVYTQDVIDEISLIAYFGYDYPGHQTERYYAAAQKLIWEQIIHKPVTVYTGNVECSDAACGGLPVADLSAEVQAIRALMDEFKLMRIGWKMEYAVSSRYPKGTALSDPSDMRKDEVVKVSITSGDLSRYRFTEKKGLVLCDETGRALSEQDPSSASQMQAFHNVFYVKISDPSICSFTLTTALLSGAPADVPFLLTSGNRKDQEMIRRGRVRNADTKTQKFSVKQTEIRLSVMKKDPAGKPLSGASLAVSEKGSDTVLYEWTSGTEEHVIAPAAKLLPGKTYVLKEIKAPAGSVRAADKEFTIPADVPNGYTAKIEMTDPAVYVLKTDENGNALAGAKLAVIDQKTGKTVDTIVSAKQKQAVNGLESGKTYILRETEAPAGFRKAADVTFTPKADQVLTVTMKDSRNPVTVSLKKTDSSGRHLSGAEFSVCEKGSDTVLYTIREQDGAYTVKDAARLLNGHTYVIRETKTPAGYVTALPVSFTVPETVNSGQVLQVTMKDPRISVLKTDETGTALTGAVLQVREKDSGEIRDEWTSGTEKHYISHLQAGKTYILSETKVPAGYVKMKDLTFTAEAEKDLHLKAVNTRAKIHLKIRKTDGSGRLMNGAVLAVLEKGKSEPLYQWTTDGKEYELQDADKLKPSGKYILRELKAPEGYVKAADAEFSIPETYPDGYAVSVSMKNTQVKVLKKDDAGSPLSGAVLTVTDAESGKTADQWTTTLQPHIVKNLFAGKTYILKETSAPFGHAVMKEIRFTADGEKDITLEGTDSRLKIYVSVLKKDSYDPEITLAGAEFTVFEKDSGKPASAADGKPAVLITGADGKAETSLFWRKEGYFLKETKAPEGYRINSDKPFDIVPDQTYTFTADDPAFRFTMTNTADTSVTVRKTDAETGERTQGDSTFEGAVFRLIDTVTDKEAGVFHIGSDGLAKEVIRGLSYRTYRLEEVTAPEGYQLLEKPIEFTLDKEHQKITVAAADQVRTGRAVIHKVFDESEHSGLVQEEENAEFAVILKSFVMKHATFAEALEALRTDPSLLSAKEWSEGKTDEKGVFRTGELAYGTYILKQTAASDAAVAAVQEPYEIEIGKEEKEITLHFSNKPLRFRFRIVKKDADSGKIITWSSASFRLKDENGNAAVFQIGSSDLDTFMTASDTAVSPYGAGVYYDEAEQKGYVTLPMPLSAGRSYTIEEIRTPQGYLKGGPVPIVISEESMQQADENGNCLIVTEVKDRRAHGTLKLHKRIAECEADTSLVDRKDLSPITFTLTAAEDITDPSDGSVLYPKGSVYGTYHPDPSGELQVTDIPLGSYVLKETEVPAGILKDETEYPVTFIQTDETTEEYIAELTLENKTTKTVFSKTDAADEKELPGASLTVTDAETGAVIDEWISGEKPHVIEGLMPGHSYQMTETAVPDSRYAKAETITFKVNTDGTVTKAYMKNRIITVSKQDIAGKELSGAKMSVTDEEGNTIDEWTSSDTPHAVCGLEEGRSYVIHEDTAPLGYVRVTDIPFTLTEEIQNIIVTDQTVTVSKQDIAGRELPGARMSVTDEKGRVIDEWTSSDTPHMVNGLEEGRSYVIHEDTAPLGYVRATDIPFTVTDEPARKIVVRNQIITVSKQDLTGRELPGAKMQVTDAKGREVDAWVSGEKPHQISGLEEGNRYILREITAPFGFYCCEEIAFTAGKEKSDVQLVMKDIPVRYQILKKDENGEAVEGVHLQLHDITDGQETAVSPEGGWITGKEPILLEGLLEAGHTYRLSETDWTEGVHHAEDIVFEVPAAAESEELVSIVMEDLRTSVAVLKTDAAGRPLAGAVLTLSDEAGNILHEWTTSEEAEDISAYVRGGMFYTVRETEAPFGYQTAEEVTFKAEGTASLHQLISMTDHRQSFRLKIFKTSDDGRNMPLSGAEFTVYDSRDGKPLKDRDGNPAKAVTDESGYAVFELPYSEDGYYVMETKAPEGYMLSPLRYEVKIPADHSFSKDDPVIITVTDSDIPRTGDSSLGKWILLLALSASAVFLAVILRKQLSGVR
ncbi:MAG: hypothetical protein K6A40_02340 [Solobacterium sp.]|nr:hypothetical protein [Solobacterium sp.]